MKPSPDLPTPWMTTAGAAAYVGASEKTVLRAVQAGALKHVRLAGNLRLRFRREWLDEWLMGDAQDSGSGAGGNGITTHAAESKASGGQERAAMGARDRNVKVQ